LSEAPSAMPEQRDRPPGVKGAAPGGARVGIDKRWIAVAVAGVAVAAVLLAGRFADQGSEGGKPVDNTASVLPLPPPVDSEAESRVLRDESELALGETTAEAMPPDPLFEEVAPDIAVPVPEAAPESAVEVTPPSAPPPPVKPVPSAPPPPPKTVEPRVKVVEPPVKKPAAAPVPVPAAPDDIKREAWLQGQPPGSFTLQLMALKDENDVRRAIEKYKLQDQAAYFTIQRSGQTLYALVYGAYPSRDEAVRAGQKLPAGLISGQPWARTFKSIHDDIRK